MYICSTFFQSTLFRLSSLVTSMCFCLFTVSSPVPLFVHSLVTRASVCVQSRHPCLCLYSLVTRASVCVQSRHPCLCLFTVSSPVSLFVYSLVTRVSVCLQSHHHPCLCLFTVSSLVPLFVYSLVIRDSVCFQSGYSCLYLITVSSPTLRDGVFEVDDALPPAMWGDGGRVVQRGWLRQERLQPGLARPEAQAGETPLRSRHPDHHKVHRDSSVPRQEICE